MSEQGSVFQKGGGGTNFEQLVQTALLTTMLTNCMPPCVPDGYIREIAFQTTNRGYETDDLLVIAESPSGISRLVVQVKHNVTFSVNDKIFQEVINGFWKDYNNPLLFDKEKDKLLVIKSGLTINERNHLKVLFNWAINHKDELDFITEVNRIKGKLEYLNTFRSALEKANGGKALDDMELWKFLSCIDVLEYDFLNQGSVDETYLLNLIRLCKHPDCTAGDKAIWAEIFQLASNLNRDGGSVDVAELRAKPVFHHFDIKKISPYAKAVLKLKDDGYEVLRPIKSYLGTSEESYCLPRHGVDEEIVGSISKNQLTIVTGIPGVGKSATVKRMLENYYGSSSIFVFRADQFGQPTISNVLYNQGINESIVDIFSCISLIHNKIIFIDSLEKLLEYDPDCAFKQLVSLMKEFPDIRIVSTSRKFAVDLVMQKFGLDEDRVGICDIPTFSDAELAFVKQRFPRLQGVLSNNNLKELLRSPKYLDFALTMLRKNESDYSNVTLQEFRTSLWNHLVANASYTKNGLPIKREQAFSYIAVKRAKEMALFVKVPNLDAEAVLNLERDGIILQGNQDRCYSPAHDIFEDWALVRHVQDVFENSLNATHLFSSLGNEPAIRRAFRLWVEEFGDSAKINLYSLLSECIASSSIHRYWADEILIAIFRSSKARIFFQTFKAELLKQDANLLKRCILLIRTACKEKMHNDKTEVLLPIGSGWEACAEFIAENKKDLKDFDIGLIRFLSDWRYRFRFNQTAVLGHEISCVKNIVLSLLNRVENSKRGEDFIRDNEVRILLSLLFDLSAFCKKEIEDLMLRAQRENNNAPYANHYYGLVIKECLSGIGNRNLVQHLPETVITTLWGQWKLKPRKTNPEEHSFFPIVTEHEDEAWGISASYTHISYPPGIYKTPVYNLLWCHPFIGFKFITEFINYSIEYYHSKSEKRHKHHIEFCYIEVNGEQKKIYGSYELWSAYRGLSVTHYLLQSLLVSLEKYLLEVAQIKTDASRYALKRTATYLIANTNNVSILGVLSSILMAYPEEFGEEILPLLSLKDIYAWDLSRATGEGSIVVLKDDQMPLASEETYKFNQLPHRRKYLCGIQTFICDYLLMVRKINEGIFNVLDRFWAEAEADDIRWRKKLTEMDIRKWQSSSQHDDPNIITIQPSYEPSVLNFIESVSEKTVEHNQSAEYGSLLLKKLRGEKEIPLSKWEEIYLYYTVKSEYNLYDMPITLAHIGLKEFWETLDFDKRGWCKATLKHAISRIVGTDSPYELAEGINLMETDTALQSLHLIYSSSYEENDEAVYLTLKTLTRYMHHHELREITKYARTVLFKRFPSEMHKVWLGLIEHAKYSKSNRAGYMDDITKHAAASRRNKLLETLSKAVCESDISKVTFEDYEASELVTVFLITPFKSAKETYFAFFNHFILLVLNDLLHEESYSYNYRELSRNVHYELISAIKPYLAEIILHSEEKLTSELFEKILFLPTVFNTRHRRGDDPFSFTSYTLEFMSLLYYDLFVNEQPKELNETKLRFWRLWRIAYSSTKTTRRNDLYKVLFLNADVLMDDYNGVANNHQFPYLKDGKPLFVEMISEVKHKDKAICILKLYANIGSDTFLPERIGDLVDAFKEQPLLMIDGTALKLIKKLFYNHIMIIKSHQELLNSFLWILDAMVDYGYSEAYLFRENTITYKKVA